MTIIVADRYGMASDSRVSDGDLEYDDTKIYITDTAVLGCVGNLSHARWFVDWYINKRSTRIKDVLVDTKHDWDVLVYDRNQRNLAVWNKYMYPDVVTVPVYTMGSGQGIAFGAYHALLKSGKKSKLPLVVQAAQIAVDHAVGCGGEIQYVAF